MGNQQKEDINDIVRRRNALILDIFRECEVPVRLIGDPNKPMLVYNEMAFLSAYVHNFDLTFLEEPGSNVNLGTYKLRKNHRFTHNVIMDRIRVARHNAVIKVRQVNSLLCLSGYGYQNPELSLGRYPVFARYGHKVYYEADYVDNLCAELNAEDYNVHPYYPGLGETSLHLIFPEKINNND